MQFLSIRATLLNGARRFFCVAIFFWLTFSLAAFGQVLTEHNDQFRTGAVTNETHLTYANVKATTFGKLFTDSVDGIIVGQPLYVPGLHFADGTHNVIYVATQHDSVFAFDADRPQAPLWTVSFINPAAGITTVPISDFGCTGIGFTEIGIMSTPVIDQSTGAIYVVAKTLENGVYIYRLHALSLTTGQDIALPVIISASANTKTGPVQFNPSIEMQRAGLALANGTIYIGFGSNGCDTFKYRGWLLAYNELNLQPVGTLLPTPNGSKGGIWQAGVAPAVDTDGTLFLAVGDGPFDASSGGSDYGDSILHLNPASNGMNVVDYFTPEDELNLFNSNLDLGSSGILLLPDQSGPHTHELIGGGKEGTLYLVDRDNMGGFNSGSDSQIVQSIPGASTGELDGVPAYWKGNVYVAGEGDFLRAFSLQNGVLSSQATSQTSVAFNQAGSGPVSVSSDPTLNNGIVWAMIHGGLTAYLFAFNANDLSKELYSSSQAANRRDALGGVAHFTTPTVANGRVYVGGTTMLSAYGLLPILSPEAGNNQSGFLAATLPTPLTVLAKDAYSGQPVPDVSLTCKDGGVGGTFSNPTPVTNSQGLASTVYTLPNKRVNITITCTNPAYPPATFSESAVAGPASRLLVTSGNFQTIAVSASTPAPLVVTVYDAHSFGVSGVPVTFSDGGAGGTFSPASSVSGSTGQASTVYKAPSHSGIVNLTATVSGLTPVSFKVTVYGTPSRWVMSSGNNQVAAVNTQLPLALGVTVYDSTNIAVPGVTVAFNDGGKGGSLSAPTAVTANTGKATTLYTTPASSGIVNVTASTSGLTPLNFKVSVYSAPTHLAISSGNNQTAAPSTRLPVAFVVGVFDATNVGVPGVAATFSDGGAGGTFSSGTAVTNSTGKVVTNYTTPAATGTFSVTASALGLAPVTFKVTVR